MRGMIIFVESQHAAAQYSQQQYQYRLAGYAPAPSAPFGPHSTPYKA